jgi:hypothetical protein
VPAGAIESACLGDLAASDALRRVPGWKMIGAACDGHVVTYMFRSLSAEPTAVAATFLPGGRLADDKKTATIPHMLAAPSAMTATAPAIDKQETLDYFASFAERTRSQFSYRPADRPPLPGEPADQRRWQTWHFTIVTQAPPRLWGPVFDRPFTTISRLDANLETLAWTLEGDIYARL